MSSEASGDIVGGADDWPRKVVGWFTPDYRHWAERLAHSLERVGEPYHLLACARTAQFWEAETMRKPRIVRDLRSRYPSKTLVLLDVDCTARRSLEPLVQSTRGDVAAYVRAKSSGRGKERARIKVMSGTMVFRPTEGATRFVEAWDAAISECDQTDVDQTALMIAFGRATGFTFEPLSAEWCALDQSYYHDPAILHDNASLGASKKERPPLSRNALRWVMSSLRERISDAARLLPHNRLALSLRVDRPPDTESGLKDLRPVETDISSTSLSP